MHRLGVRGLRAMRSSTRTQPSLLMPARDDHQLVNLNPNKDSAVSRPYASMTATAFRNPKNPFLEVDLAAIPRLVSGFDVSLDNGMAVVTVDASRHQALFVYEFGVVVGVNLGPPAEHPRLKALFASFPAGGLQSEFQEDYMLVEDPMFIGLEGATAKAFNEMIVVHRYSWDAILIVSHVLAYSTALNLSRSVVDELYHRFEVYLKEQKRLSTRNLWERLKSEWLFTGSRKRALLLYMHELNEFHLFLNKQFGIVEWSDSGWNDAELGQVHQTMLTEFLIKKRYLEQNARIHFMHTNFKTFFDIGTSNEGNISEKMIVFLFAFEVALTLYQIRYP